MNKKIIKRLSTIVIMLLVLSACGRADSHDGKRQFIVGMECGYTPYNWTESVSTAGSVPIDGNQYCTGFDVEMARLIADDLDRELVVKKVGWEGLILAAQSGQIDAIIAGMSPTEERKQEISFTDVYYKANFGVVVSKDGKFASGKTIDDFSGMQVAAQMGTFHVQLIPQLVGAVPVDPMKDFPTMTVALNSGQIDGFVTEDATGKSIEAANDGLIYLQLKGERGFSVADEFAGTAIGMKKGNPLLVDVNASLKKIPNSTREQLMEKAMKQENKTSSNFFQEVWHIFTNNFSSFMSGMIITLIISVTATLLGFLLGLLVSIVRENKIGKIFTTIYITIFRGTPMMVQSMLIYYGIALAIPGFKWSSIPYGNIIAGILIVTINTGAYMAETIRSGIQALDKGQFEAAKALGFSRWQTMTTVILPQAIRNLIPAIGNELIVNIKDTSVLNVIMVSELFFVSSGVASSTYKIFQTFTVTSLIYLVLTTSFALILRQIEKRLSGKKSSYPASQTAAEQVTIK